MSKKKKSTLETRALLSPIIFKTSATPEGQEIFSLPKMSLTLQDVEAAQKFHAMLGEQEEQYKRKIDLDHETALKRISQAHKIESARLDLSGLKLESMPPEIGKLKKLTVLILSNVFIQRPNYFTTQQEEFLKGTFSREIGQLFSLRELDLSQNSLKNVPDGIGQLTYLKTLDLSNNMLTELSPKIGLLAHLETLNLSYNNLTELPAQIRYLNRLGSFDLSHNQLANLPPEIGQMTNLLSLDLRGNPLHTIPAAVNKLALLKSLKL